MPDNRINDHSVAEVSADVRAILGALHASMRIPPERRLWGMTEIAEYSGYSPSTVQQRIVCLPTFPKRIKADATSQPRWPAGEVMKWFEGRRETRR